MNFDKYNPLKKPPIQNWKESDAVILLSEYLRIHKNQGIKLYQHDGAPCLVFNPPLKIKDADRWQIAENVCGLFEDAIPDLKELIAAGKLELPDRNRTNDGKNINEAGPSGALESIRVAKPQSFTTFKTK